jgi:hypothetical protein
MEPTLHFASAASGSWRFPDNADTGPATPAKSLKVFARSVVEHVAEVEDSESGEDESEFEFFDLNEDGKFGPSKRYMLHSSSHSLLRII